MIRNLLLVALLLCSAHVACAEAPAVRLAGNGKALLIVTTSSKASAAVKASAQDLATYLSRMSGGEFKVAEGDGSGGIVLGLPKDFEKLPFAIEFGSGPFEREDYLLRSHGWRALLTWRNRSGRYACDVGLAPSSWLPAVLSG
ncbi:hypothetical protein [Anatilimnocola floriformis]|uniref:hypothetical protein n=1 Tax=Anatilimnocola floriformis TaxID=2948575 RepID=UPI0020C21A30|nr:hypothetical protein [Anatilimnocola floriformis]